MLVANIMTKDVHTVSPDNTLQDIQNIFSSAIFHHLLVEEDGVLVGVISDRDMLKHSSPFIQTPKEDSADRQQLKKKVSEFMSKCVVTVDTGTFIDCASILLLENRISCLPVVDENHAIMGIVSWKDILAYHVYGIDTRLNEHNACKD